jgi:integrase
MQSTKRPKLPRGLRWRGKSQFIWFGWRDEKGVQHQKSTETSDPAKALLVKMKFLEDQKERCEGDYTEGPDLQREPLAKVAALYFEWKTANSSATTVKRETRIFRAVERFFGPKVRVKSIKLHLIRQYQKRRREQISPTMKQQVTPRSVNYEMHLLRSVMKYADCWTDELEARYTPLRHSKRRVGKVATKEQLIQMVTTAMNNEFWQLAMHCAAVAAGTGCRGGEIRKLKLGDINLENGSLRILKEIAKNRRERNPVLLALAHWGLENLLLRARALGAQPYQNITCCP